MDWWVWPLLGVEALIVGAGIAALTRVFLARDRMNARDAEIGRRAWAARDAADRHFADLREAREQEIARTVLGWGADDLASLPPRDRSTHALAECWALWSHVPGRTVAAVRAAAEAVSNGADSPSLRELAGLSERYADTSEVRDLLAAALDELHVVAVTPESDEGQLLALRFYCLEWRAGRLGDEQLAAWAHRAIGHDGPLIAQELVELEDLFETPSFARAEVRQAVDRFLERTGALKPVRV